MDMTSPRLEAEGSAETEIELKLTTSPDNLTKLLKMVGDVDGVDTESRETKRVLSTYYDTEDRRLKRRGLTLRVRDKAGERVQTLKSDGTAVSGVLTRQEWTTPLDGALPELGGLGSPAIHDRIGLILPQELVPVFKTDVKRTTIVVHHSVPPDSSGDSARVELAFDRGRIVAGKKKQSISEVELELLQGTTTALLDLANILADRASTVLNLYSKVNRGFDLCDGTAPRAVTAFKLTLTKKVSAKEGMVRIFRSGLGHLLANRAAAVSGKDIEGVHQARVAIRRIGAALSTFHKFLSPDDTATIKEDTRWLLDSFAPARDLDVFLDEVLPAVMRDRPDDPDLKAIAKAARKERTIAYRKVRSVLSSARYTKAALSLASWIEERAWRETHSKKRLNKPLHKTAGKLLSRRHRKVLKLGRSFKSLAAQDRHRVRIALKKLRYTAEFFTDLYPKSRSRPHIAAMKRLQNTLGAANDVLVAEDLTQALVRTVRRNSKQAVALQSGAGKVLGWHSRAAADAEADMLSLWASFAESRPFWLTA